MSTILAVDTTATPVSCALLCDDRILASTFAYTGLTHSQTLMPMVEQALRLSDLTLADVDALAVSVGPGSFTGVRIGVSAVKGMGFTDNKPCVPVSTLEAMAAAVRGLPFEGVICCAMDARCQQVYTALFEQSIDGNQCRLTEDEAISIDELKNRLKKVKKSVIFVGDGAELCYNECRSSDIAAYLAPAGCRYQSAVGVALAARQRLNDGQAVSPEHLMPFYLRLPQAERELRSRQASQK